MKKRIAFFLALLLLVSCAVPAFAAGGGIETLKINPYGGAEASVDTVRWFASGGNRFLFLPADAALAAAKVYYSASDTVRIDNVPVASGGFAESFTPGSHTLSCGGQEIAARVILYTSSFADGTDHFICKCVLGPKSETAQLDALAQSVRDMGAARIVQTS